MTTATQTGTKRRFVRPSWPVIIAAALVIALIATFAGRMFIFKSAGQLEGGTSVDVTRGSLVASIGATGEVEPLQRSELAFGARDGRVSRVLVDEGDAVAAQAPLVELDARLLEAQVAAAEAALADARANLSGRRASAPADVRAAQQSVEEARARLAALQGQPDDADLARTQATVAEAEANLNQQRTALSAAKEQARRTVDARANALRDAQAIYAQALRDQQRAVDGDSDPVTGGPLTDSARESYINAAASAERAMLDAEAALTQAQVDYDSTRQSEITGLADAEAKLQKARAELSALLQPGIGNVVAARAQLASAEARLAQLTGAQGAGQTTDLARAEAQVAQAEAQLAQARINLEDAILRAPFGGTVAEVNVAPGEQISSISPITLIDVSRYVVKVTVDEVDVARVSVGQAAEVTIDALGGEPLRGTVTRIAPQAQAGSEVTAYQVTLEVDPASRPVKPGMTASAAIIVDRRDDAVSVPVGAVRAENGQAVVSVVTTGADGKQTVTIQPVETGLQAGDRMEIRSGLSEGQQVLVNTGG